MEAGHESKLIGIARTGAPGRDPNVSKNPPTLDTFSPRVDDGTTFERKPLMSQTNIPTRQWEYVVKLLSGHRIWKVKGTPEGPHSLAIADRSGDHRSGDAGNPDETDDGALWLGHEHDIVLSFDNGQLNVWLPVWGNDRRYRGFVFIDFRDLPVLFGLGFKKFYAGEAAKAYIKELDKSVATLRAAGYTL